MARRAHIVGADLLAALDSNHLKGALLDVFSTEPLPADSPLWTHPNIHITPHIAGISLRQESAQQVLEKLNQLRQGIEPSGREIGRASCRKECGARGGRGDSKEIRTRG